jgi:hypothetical protein
MTALTVGAGQQFATLNSALLASHDGDTIYVQAGTYTNDFSDINTKVSIVGVGGMAHFVATVSPPNGKAIFVVNTDLSIDHLEFSGAAVGDGNGAGIRSYQPGTLTITNSYFHDNQDGILAGTPANGVGVITIDHSEFSHNGDGSGLSHNIYVNDIGNFQATNSYFHDAAVGHEIKSRAAVNTITNNRIMDGNGTASYSIDLPNGGNSTVANNFIQQGPNSQNPTIIAYSEEGSPWPGSQLIVQGNTIVNQLAGTAYGVWSNFVTAQITGNHFYGLTPSQIALGPNTQSGNDTLASLPAMDTSHPWAASPWDTLISGNAAADVLAGTAGKDLFVGGAGSDTFIVGNGRDTIADFSHAQGDRIDLTGVASIASLADVLSHGTQTGADAIIDFGNGSGLTLQGVALNSLFASDFIFSNSGPDTTPPALSGTSPADNSLNVAAGSNLVLTFSESVKAGSGTLVIHNAADGSTVASIAIGDPSQVSFSGSTVTINPSSDLTASTHYYVTVDSGAIQDLAGNAFAGISGSTAFDFTTAAPPALKVAYDFNADGHSDLLWQNDSGQAAVWLMNGSSILSNASVGAADPTLHAKATGDFNGDGKADILFQSDSSQPVIWMMDGSNVIASSAVGNLPGTSWHVKGAGDFNGDGKSDILWQNDNGYAAIWLMNGMTELSGPLVGWNPGTSWHVKGAGDFDGDGKSDILWQNDSGQAAIWLMNGTSVISSPLVGSNPGTSWHIKGAGDFNGDGKSDLLWQNDNGQAQIWLMNGTNVLSSANAGANLGTSWHVMGAEDFNGDGKSDIAWQNDNGQPAVWLMNGTTVLETDTLATNPGSSWHIDWT